MIDTQKYHILVIPSEEFQPPESHQAGIFQLHQCLALKAAGYRVGVISIKQQYSLPMIIKEIMFRTFGRAARVQLADYRLSGLPRLLYQKLFRLERFISKDVVTGIPTLRIAGFYRRPPNQSTDYKDWVRAGIKAYLAYVDAYGKPDLIHAHNSHPAGILASRISEQDDIPFVLTEHSSYFHRGLIPSSIMPHLRRAFERASVIGVVSPRLANDLESHVGVDTTAFHWMPNVIDPEFARCDVEQKKVSTKMTFLSIGDLIPLKAHTELIKAFHASLRGKNARLIIAGSGPMQASLQQQIDHLELSDQVHMVGRLGREAVRNAIDSSDCLVLPSHYETFGVVLIESLARGKPVIATDCGGPSCIVNQDNGILVPPENIPELAKALEQMFGSHTLYDHNAIHRDAMERFGQDRLVSDLTVAYTKAFNSSQHLNAA